MYTSKVHDNILPQFSTNNNKIVAPIFVQQIQLLIKIKIGLITANNKHLNRVFVSHGWNLKRKILAFFQVADLFASLLRFALHTLLHFLMGLFFNNKLHVASINRLIHQAHLFWLELGGDQGGVQDNTATLDDNYIFSMSSFSRVLFSNFLSYIPIETEQHTST
ncbi:hypothetical protein ACJX0J_006253, partial [Zea mays]